MILRLTLGMAALLFVAAACGEIPEPDSFAIATPSTIDVAGAPEDETAEIEPEEVVSADAASTAQNVPSRPPGYVPELLISSDSAILVAGPDSLAPLAAPFGTVSAASAVDDFTGGLAVQATADGAASGPGSVLWLRAEGGDPVVVDEEGALLLDVGYVDGAPTALVSVGQDQIDRIRLLDEERETLLVLGDEEELVDLSASGGLNAIVVRNDRCGDLRFYSADGSEIDLNGPGEPDCIVPRRPAYGAVALSPDGGAIAFTEVSYRDDGIEVATDLVAQELSTGTEYYREQIGEDGERITALSFDGDRVAYLRKSEGETSAVVTNLTTTEVNLIDVSGIVGVDSLSFARFPVAGS